MRFVPFAGEALRFGALRILVNVEALLELHQFVRQSVGVKPGMLDLRLLRTTQTTAAVP